MVIALRTSSRQTKLGQAIGLDVHGSRQNTLVLSHEILLFLLLVLEDDLGLSWSVHVSRCRCDHAELSLVKHDVGACSLWDIWKKQC